jgi:hypothetical protein
MNHVALRNAELAKKRLKEEIQRLSAELDRKRLELKQVDTFLQQWAKFAAPQPDLMEDERGELVPWKNPSREAVGRAVRTILLTNGKPMLRDELFGKLQTSGTDIRGKDPKMILSTMLWRMPDRFVRLKGFGYWPREMPYPPAHYDPDVSR